MRTAKEINYTEKAVKGMLWVLILGVFTNAFAYLLRILLARRLSTPEFGLVYSVIAFFGMIYIFQVMGLDYALVKKIAEAKAKGQWKQAKSALIFVVGLHLALSLIILVGAFLLRDWLSLNYFKNPYATTLILIHAFMMIVLPFESAFICIFQGIQKMKFYSMLWLVRAGIVFFSTWAMINQFGVAAPFIGYLIAVILPLPFWYNKAKKIQPEIFAAKYEINLGLAKKMFRFGIPLMVVSFVGFVISYTDTLVLTYFRTLQEVGIYNAAQPTAALLWFFGNTLFFVIFPISTELYHKNLRSHLSQGMEKAYTYSIVLLIPIMITLIVYSDQILRLFFGEMYAQGSTVFRILTAGALFYSLSRINDGVLAGIGKTGLVAISSGIAATANITLNIILVPPFGITGAASATFISLMVMFAVGYNYVLKQIKFRIEWRKSLKIATAGIAYLLIIGLGKLDGGVLAMLFFTGFGMIAYLGALILTKIVNLEEIKGLFISL